MADARAHWEAVYNTKNEDEVSWYQSSARISLSLIRSAAPSKVSSILDIGGGASHLVDELLADGYTDLTVLDISDSALSKSKARLGSQAAKVSWIVADIITCHPARTWQLWHDRAVFHFQTSTDDQNAYIAALRAATVSGSVAVMSCFALDGPERCSGLPVQRYSAGTLAARLGDDFQLISNESERHTTPWGSVQSFVYAAFKRR